MQQLLAPCRDTPGVHPIDYLETDRILNVEIKELSARLRYFGRKPLGAL